MRYAVVCLLASVAGCSEVASRHSVVMGERTRPKLEARTGRPSSDIEDVPAPTPADPDTRPPEPPAPAEREEKTVLVPPPPKMTAAVYGAKWCTTCALVNPAMIEAQRRGYLVEYRDLDDEPTPHIKQVPAVIIYQDDFPIYTATGFLDVTDTLRKYLP